MTGLHKVPLCLIIPCSISSLLPCSSELCSLFLHLLKSSLIWSWWQILISAPSSYLKATIPIQLCVCAHVIADSMLLLWCVWSIYKLLGQHCTVFPTSIILLSCVCHWNLKPLLPGNLKLRQKPSCTQLFFLSGGSIHKHLFFYFHLGIVILC